MKKALYSYIIDLEMELRKRCSLQDTSPTSKLQAYLTLHKRSSGLASETSMCSSEYYFRFLISVVFEL